MRERKGINMRVGIIVGLLCLLIGLGVILPMMTEDRPQDEYEGVLRFHVKANSDSIEDQELKMAVKEEVFSKIEKGITKAIQESTDSEVCANLPEAFRQKKTIEYIDENLRNIERWAKDCVTQRGYNYDVKAQVGITTIPAKEYDGIYFPAGNYNALTITIGEGRGQNWWCVIFPPLCLVDCKDSEYKDAFGVDDAGRLVLKSKILELLSDKEPTWENSDNDIELAGEGELMGALAGVKEQQRSRDICFSQ